MADMPSVEQAGNATVWFTSQAGITATVLAVVCIALAAALVWSVRNCRHELAGLKREHEAVLLAIKDGHEERLLNLLSEWGKRIDGFRSDIKDAFGQNSDIADRVVEAMNKLGLEIARMSGRRERA